MILVGLTGGIGSGKSYVASLMHREWGIPVYDCDARAKHLNQTDPVLRRALTEMVGENVYDADGRLNKSVLAQFLFQSDENARRVNETVHPAVLRDMQQWVSEQHAPLAIVESAILCESGFDAYVDFIALVEADDETRIRRAMQRDSATRSQIEARMARQDTTEARRKARLTIRNDEGTTDREILSQCRPIHDLADE